MTWDTLPLLLNVDEVSAVLRLPPKTVYLLIQRGKLLGKKMGKQIRVSRQALQKYAETPD